MDFTVREVEKQITNALSVLEAVTDVRVPKSIKEALDEEWLAAAEDGGLELLERVDRKELAAWGRRAMSVERANFLLVAFEDALVGAFVTAPDSPWRIAIKRLASIPKFILSHAGEIDEFALPLMTALLQNAIVLGHAAALQGIEDGVNRTGASFARWVREKTGLPLYQKGRADFVPDSVSQDYKSRMQQVEVAILGIVALVGYWSVERMLAVVRTAIAYKSRVESAFTLRTEIVERGQKAAFPQAQRKSYVRKKRSRRG